MLGFISKFKRKVMLYSIILDEMHSMTFIIKNRRKSIYNKTRMGLNSENLKRLTYVPSRDDLQPAMSLPMMKCVHP